MTNKYIILLLLLFPIFSFGQQKILFVDDSGDQFFNSQYLASTLDSLGYEYYFYDAYGLNESPFADEMLEFDIVIWHTSTWGVGLHLWNTDKTLNPELVTYLNDPKAKFWLIGNDFMYDRYGLPVVDFVEGDFPYDYLGISQYKSQSYADDGKLGMQLATFLPESHINANSLTWSVGNLWYADGFVLTESATPVYMMDGANDYPLKFEVTGCSNITPAGGHVLTYGFDLSLAENFTMMKTNVAAVINWFDGLAGSKKIQSLNAKVSAFPNPTNGPLNLQVTAVQEINVTIDLLDIQGNLIANLDAGVIIKGRSTLNYSFPEGTSSGQYLIRISTASASQTTKVLYIK